MSDKKTPMQRLQQLITDNESLTAQLTDVRGQLTARDGELVTARDQVTALTGERDGLSARVLAFEAGAAAHTTAVEALAADRNAFDRLLSDGVSGKIAQMGISEGRLPASSETPAGESEGDLHARFDAMKSGRAKSAFYKKHEAVLSKPRPAVAK